MKTLRRVWLLSQTVYVLPEYLRNRQNNIHLTEEERKRALLQFLIFEALFATSLNLSSLIALDECLFSPIICLFFGILSLQCCFLHLLYHHRSSIGVVAVLFCLQLNFSAVFLSLFCGTSNDFMAWCVIIPMLQFFVSGKRAGMIALKLVLIECAAIMVVKEYLIRTPDDRSTTYNSLMLASLFLK